MTTAAYIVCGILLLPSTLILFSYLKRALLPPR